MYKISYGVYKAMIRGVPFSRFLQERPWLPSFVKGVLVVIMQCLDRHPYCSITVFGLPYVRVVLTVF